MAKQTATTMTHHKVEPASCHIPSCRLGSLWDNIFDSTRRLSHFKRVTGFNRADAEECLTVLAIEIPELERASEAALEEIERGAIKARERLHNLFQNAFGDRQFAAQSLCFYR